jgi:hypothetical protein
MFTRKTGLTIAAAVVASAFGTAAVAQSEAARSETVLSFRDTGDTLRVRVATGGCTSANDFNFNVDRSGGRAQVTLVRVVPDNCKGNFPEGTEIAISYEAAGVQRAEQVQLMNRVAPQR